MRAYVRRVLPHRNGMLDGYARAHVGLAESGIDMMLPIYGINAVGCIRKCQATATAHTIFDVADHNIICAAQSFRVSAA